MKVIKLHISEGELLQKVAKNDRRAQKRLYEQHSPRMLSVCRQYVSDLSVAEELMNNGFFKVFTRIASFQHQGSFEGWVRRIMVHECLDYLKKSRDFKWPVSVDEEKLTAEDEEELDVPSLEILQRAIDSLPEGYKIVFNLYAIDGMKHREIAKTLEISENTSKSQFRKARLMLQEKLEEFKRLHHEA